MSCQMRLAAALVLVLLATLACGPKLTAEEQTELIRSQYTAELKSLTVKQDPLAAGSAEPMGEALAGAAAADAEGIPPAAPESAPAGAETAAEGGATEAAGDETGGGVDAAITAAPSVRSDVILDILVSTTSQEYLPGVTLDLEHVDADRRVKDRRTLWVDTSNLVRGGGMQVTHVLENVDWEEGDGFFVEVRTPIPATERADYREFQAQ